MRKLLLLSAMTALLLLAGCAVQGGADLPSSSVSSTIQPTVLATPTALPAFTTPSPTPTTDDVPPTTTVTGTTDLPAPNTTTHTTTRQTDPAVPVTTKTPVTTTQSVTTAKPATTKPVTTAKPITTTAPVTTQLPVTTAKPITTSPIPDPSDPQGPMWDLSGDFGAQFYYKFSDDDSIVSTDGYYRSHDLCIEITKVDKLLLQKEAKSSSSVKETHVIYYVAHIYIRNIENLFSAHQVGINTTPSQLMQGTGTVFSINGDVFNTDRSVKEVIIRNGEVIRYKKTITSDICVLYEDGSMETIPPAEYDWEELLAKNPYQVWSFGPELLSDDGSAKTNIKSNVWRLNPRAAIGCVEPGHYVIVGVDGNRDGKTTGGDGMNMDELAKVMSAEGCKQAYNLDGGASVYCYYEGEYLISFTKNRKISDMICIGERSN